MTESRCRRFRLGLAALFAAAMVSPLCAEGAGNPFGMFLSGKQLTPALKQKLLTETFKVPYYRPSALFLDRFEKDGDNADCDFAVAAGLKMVLVVRNSGQSYQPAKPPLDLDHYKQVLGHVLDKYGNSIALLIVENEQDGSLFWSGTTAEYLAELKAAAAVAHAHGIKCADGGITSMGVIVLLADYYATTGQMDKAVVLLKRTRMADVRGERQVLDLLRQHAAELARLKALLAGYKDAGVDYLNFHWYERDPQAFADAVAFLQRIGNGLPVITDEIGQWNDDPRETEWKMKAARDLGMPFVIWFSMDSLKSHSLVNDNGTLRPTGVAFQRVVAETTASAR